MEVLFSIVSRPAWLIGDAGEGNYEDGDMGRHGHRGRNDEGQTLVDLDKGMQLAIPNTFAARKRVDHRVTCCSGGQSSEVDWSGREI